MTRRYPKAEDLLSLPLRRISLYTPGTGQVPSLSAIIKPAESSTHNVDRLGTNYTYGEGVNSSVFWTGFGISPASGSDMIQHLVCDLFTFLKIFFRNPDHYLNRGDG